MLPRKQRFKVWAALSVLGGWFVGCYALVAYRLKSDDLELMEREVYEELQKKKEVERFVARQKREQEIARNQMKEITGQTSNNSGLQSPDRKNSIGITGV